ncbi:MAG: LysR substrate-binding domain-containing protein, partial [Pseudomonadota bacterium]
VTTVDGISGLLAPVVRAYHARFPEVRVQLHSNDRALDLRRREADVAVRVTKNPDEDLFGRKIADIGFRPFASAALVDEQGAKLRELRWIGRDHSAGATDTEAWFQKTLPGTEPIIRVTHTTSMVDLTLAGVGAAILPTPIGQRAGLTPLDDEIDELRTQLWCLCHRDLRYSDRVRGFMDVAGHALRL